MDNKPKILVVDDNDAVRLSLTEYLIDVGYETVSVSTAEDAIVSFSAYKPDLGVIDLRLPGLDGIEFIRKAHKIYPEMRFIIYTGSFDAVIPNDIKNLGCVLDHVVIKPLRNLSDIELYIRKIMDDNIEKKMN